ncbi:MAG: S-adenosylmethionine decarboxylase [Candidatus Omnitrophica bacterium]|nr:S-adenosylmethionine decarboxylase [Candidatus Omnitrophota bacterium]MBU4346692.1 S-adenosylmethionine decarboxylase [Candidatus Omnitrophota bacterium]MBU4472770.1 S-adenosylmethionine decarboxylase [Candidatus Omnitrophota bacterium]MCG2706374.1 S-adenosylmethionine decarboxylase [Candidatus Omnitrophota bacterium]
MKKKKIYGYELILDLYNCNPQIIKSRSALQKYVDTLCRVIKMKKYGKTLIPHFGYDKPYTKGYSLVQLIETSSITGHFSELWNSAHINIFSCKKYDHKKARNFTRKFFQAKSISNRLIVRKTN